MCLLLLLLLLLQRKWSIAMLVTGTDNVFVESGLVVLGFLVRSSLLLLWLFRSNYLLGRTPPRHFQKVYEGLRISWYWRLQDSPIYNGFNATSRLVYPSHRPLAHPSVDLSQGSRRKITARLTMTMTMTMTHTGHKTLFAFFPGHRRDQDHVGTTEHHRADR